MGIVLSGRWAIPYRTLCPTRRRPREVPRLAFPSRNGWNCRIAGVLGISRSRGPATLAGLSVCGVRPR